MPAEEAIAFGPFRLLRKRAQLLEAGKPVRLGGRALALLTILVDRAGEIVTRDELIAHVWPETFVEDNNLRVHLTALRKILGDGQEGARYIINVAGRGYSFVAPVTHIWFEANAQGSPASLSSLPAIPVRLVGRAEAIGAIAEHLRLNRFVTVAGPGGIGKSTVTLASAELLRRQYRDGAQFVDLAAVADPAQALDAIGSAFGLSLRSSDRLAGLVDALRSRNLLLVLDNCEHVLGVIAEVAGAIFANAPGIAILCTSIEPLGAEGEFVYQLPPLGLPKLSEITTAAEAIRFPAVQLFVERAAAVMEAYVFTDADAARVVRLCRRLDGIPLAIEIAAARVDVFGVQGLLDRLDDLTFNQKLRAGRPQHRSLRALLDWSFELLEPADRTALARLSVFRSNFTVASAESVTATENLSAAGVREALGNLAAKSLVATNASGDVVTHRLLDTTRRYAFERLVESGEAQKILRRHAQHLVELLGEAEKAWEVMTPPTWRTRFGWMIDDMRAALEWTFSSEADTPLGIRLSAAALPIAFQLAAYDEATSWGERGLAKIENTSLRDLQSEMWLAGTLASLQQILRPGMFDERMLTRALKLADELNQPAAKFLPTMSIWLQAFSTGDYRNASVRAEMLAAVAQKTGRPTDRLTADRVMAQTRHFIGDHEHARALAERVIIYPLGQLPLYQSPTPIDRRVSMRIIISRVLWLQGQADQARSMVREAMTLAEADTQLSPLQVLALAACPIAFWCGDDAEAAELVETLRSRSAELGATYWSSWAKFFRAALSWRAGVLVSAVEEMSSSERDLGAKQLDMVATIAPELTTSETIARVDRGDVGWCAPEVLRIKALRLLADRNAGKAEAILLASKKLAGEQGALAWELRTATTLAQFWQSQSRRAEASDMLGAVHARIVEGHETADVRAAMALLKELD